MKVEPLSSQKTPCSYSVEAVEVPISPTMDSMDSNLGFSCSTLTADSKCGGLPTVFSVPGKERSLDIETKSSASGGEDVFGSSGQLTETKSAVQLQKVYRSYRTRRKLADSVVVAEELWWQAIDYARLNHSTISFFNFEEHESAALRWSRISSNAAKVGKGLSKDTKAQILAFQHWIEAIDPRHRYGHNLHCYYEEWCKSDAGQPFFFWLDVGDGKDVNLEQCPRSKLRRERITYLGPQEREHYEYIVVEGKIIHKQSGCLLDTNESRDAKWIFVMSTAKKLYAGEKKKRLFHHSSFLAGGATLAAGRLDSDHGVLKSISAYSGHYRPTDDSLGSFLAFLKENGVNVDEIQIRKASEDYEGCNELKFEPLKADSETPPAESVAEEDNRAPSSESAQEQQTEAKNEYKRALSGGLQSPRADVPKTAILQRINSKKSVKSYQLGHQISLRWCSGAGPRIGCVANYPEQLRVQALEFVNLSPKTPRTPSYPLSTELAPPTSHEQSTSD